jgi:hypothetical protein
VPTTLRALLQEEAEVVLELVLLLLIELLLLSDELGVEPFSAGSQQNQVPFGQQ